MIGKEMFIGRGWEIVEKHDRMFLLTCVKFEWGRTSNYVSLEFKFWLIFRISTITNNLNNLFEIMISSQFSASDNKLA